MYNYKKKKKKYLSVINFVCKNIKMDLAQW